MDMIFFLINSRPLESNKRNLFYESIHLFRVTLTTFYSNRKSPKEQKSDTRKSIDRIIDTAKR